MYNDSAGEIDYLQSQINGLSYEDTRLERKIDELENVIDKMKERMKKLEERLAKIEGGFYDNPR